MKIKVFNAYDHPGRAGFVCTPRIDVDGMTVIGSRDSDARDVEISQHFIGKLRELEAELQAARERIAELGAEGENLIGLVYSEHERANRLKAELRIARRGR